MAAKGKYSDWITEEGLLRLEAMARDGLTDAQIAHNIGIAKQTLYEWKKLYPDFSDALKRGKQVVDIQVENALLKRALGYEYEETTQEIYEDPNFKGTDGKPKQRKHIKKVTRVVPPDVTAQIFWLKNRKPDMWRDKHEVTDNTALEKLDAILRNTHENAFLTEAK